MARKVGSANHVRRALRVLVVVLSLGPLLTFLGVSSNGVPRAGSPAATGGAGERSAALAPAGDALRSPAPVRAAPRRVPGLPVPQEPSAGGLRALERQPSRLDSPPRIVDAAVPLARSRAERMVFLI
jgi:hypothetical protein